MKDMIQGCATFSFGDAYSSTGPQRFCGEEAQRRFFSDSAY